MSSFGRFFAAAVWFIVASSGSIVAFAQTPRVDGIDIIEAGIYEPGPSNSLQFVAATTEIPGRVGVKFGFRYAVRGPTSAIPVRMTVVTRLPQRGGQLDPKTGLRRFRIEEQVLGRVGAETTSGFSFDEPWEVVLGDWILEVWIGESKMAEQRFRVVAR